MNAVIGTHLRFWRDRTTRLYPVVADASLTCEDRIGRAVITDRLHRAGMNAAVQLRPVRGIYHGYLVAVVTSTRTLRCELRATRADAWAAALSRDLVAELGGGE